MRVERLQQPGKEATGSRHGPEVARQTVDGGEGDHRTTDRDVDGGDTTEREPDRRLEAGAGQQRSTGSRRDDRRGTSGIPAGCMARDPRATAGRHRYSCAGARGIHTEAGWGSTGARAFRRSSTGSLRRRHPMIGVTPPETLSDDRGGGRMPSATVRMPRPRPVVRRAGSRQWVGTATR